RVSNLGRNKVSHRARQTSGTRSTHFSFPISTWITVPFSPTTKTRSPATATRCNATANPVGTAFQDLPSSPLTKTRPLLPTATARGSLQVTSVRISVVVLATASQLVPASVLRKIVPRSPTVKSGFPFRTTNPRRLPLPSLPLDTFQVSPPS